jgi:UDP-N-acetylmuramyl pentapeptide synthase
MVMMSDCGICAVPLKAGSFFYGLGPDNDFRAEEIESHKEAGITFTACTPAGTGIIKLPLPGRHNVVNALAALAVGASFGMSLPDMARGWPVWSRLRCGSIW